MRVVVDTNVVVSALLFGASVPGRAFVRVLDLAPEYLYENAVVGDGEGGR